MEMVGDNARGESEKRARVGKWGISSWIGGKQTHGWPARLPRKPLGPLAPGSYSTT